ncbi:uncharacterized protein LOC101206373 isoform X1 [Cucumis sativus]|uniref:uncharacterized protein LOC101206373 isoform X1 n=1 Tax=Cucumis sativus TaxID=3659 RepID=UPI0012F487C8|nr:uncharacterized protein LOC101206373 isoform X1 [Cucumis sativus]XP_031738308.1 uncharacterized protein LOC101206373 isoform X1 [Cucumis sativus]XP_031738309.1 uncharacterized protein LOC101206373 isoform X1 [Cucumis sativus]
MSEHIKEAERVGGDGHVGSEESMSSSRKEEEVIKKKYGGIVPKKPPLISKVLFSCKKLCILEIMHPFTYVSKAFESQLQDHERAYFDSADWALGKQGVEKPKGPLEALRPKLQPTQQQTRYRKSPCAPSDGEDGGTAQNEYATSNE